MSLRLLLDSVVTSLWHEVTNTKHCLLARWVQKFIAIVFYKSAKIERQSIWNASIDYKPCEAKKTATHFEVKGTATDKVFCSPLTRPSPPSWTCLLSAASLLLLLLFIWVHHCLESLSYVCTSSNSLSNEFITRHPYKFYWNEHAKRRIFALTFTNRTPPTLNSSFF